MGVYRIDWDIGLGSGWKATQQSGFFLCSKYYCSLGVSTFQIPQLQWGEFNDQQEMDLSTLALVYG